MTPAREIDLCGVPLRGPVLNGSGTFDAIAARRTFGDALLERFPFDAFVSKTITLAPRQGNPPPRLWELGAGMINSIGLPNKGLEGFTRHDLPELAEDVVAEVYACGPPPMLEAVRALCEELDVPAQLALESGMACGFGACFGCVVATHTGWRRLCVDGPVVRAAELAEEWHK